MAGGFVGVLIVGVQRAVFSNEAGIGSAAIAHAAAKTKEPVREGIVALLGPFVDTIVICLMTALVVLITGVYDDPALEGVTGAALTSQAFASVIGCGGEVDTGRAGAVVQSSARRSIGDDHL